MFSRISLFLYSTVLLSSSVRNYDPPRNIDLFHEILLSTTATPPKCHCAKPASPTKAPDCAPYDSRLQAWNLEEAIVEFPDLTIALQDRTSQNSVDRSLNNCKTKQCRDCYKDIRNQLRKVGLLPSVIKEVFDQQRNFSTCDKYRFSRNDRGVYEKTKKKSKQHYDWDFEDDSSEERDNDRREKSHVEKRSITSNQNILFNTTALNITGVIGDRFPIACTTRGITPDGSNTVSLCSTCWVWRRLPSNYFPAYLNEVVCDNSDSSCLSGYASCHTGTQQLNVLRNDSGTLVAVSVSAGINCECRILVGSAIESLVLGSGTSAPIPPIASTNVANSTEPLN